LCIILDDLAISAPTLRSRIGSSGQISGKFTEIERSTMVKKLKAGSLPARLNEQPISVKTIGPSIGADNRDKGIRAGIIGLITVVVCMAVYYAIAGSIADLALLINILFVLAIMAFIKATFTLPGIAGIILTIGMSVDANVLIFERIREEQAKGASIRIAIRNGYQRAFRTIFDANLTTFITAFILFWVASEEIKGFALVLMLGIASSMFTALFATRVVFDMLLNAKIIKEQLSMRQLIKSPNINWMKLRPVFLTISGALMVLGLITFFTRDNSVSNKYDIEFTGGTSAVINLKDDVDLTRQEVENLIQQTDLGAVNVYSIGEPKKLTDQGEAIFSQYEINTTETNKTIVNVKFSATDQTKETVTRTIKIEQNKLGATLGNLTVDRDTATEGQFVVTTSQTNKSMVKNVLSKAFADPNSSNHADISEPIVKEVVNNAILTAFEGKLQIQENLNPSITATERITDELIETYPELSDFIGGLQITCRIEKAASGQEILSRFENLNYKLDMRDLAWYSDAKLATDLNPLDPDLAVNSFVYVSVSPEAGFRELTEDEWQIITDNETRKVLAAAELETSLPKVTQIDPSIGSESKNRALVAIVLSLIAIVTYIWVRFGTARYGLAAIAALVHDVCITLGAVTACTYIAGTSLGSFLLLADFKINLAMIAAFLTIIGYSLNDTIVVFDRIRENRLKAQMSPQTITNSINQTISRTLMTSFTTFIVVLIMYIWGGTGLRGFTFAIGLGVIIGTYSSIAIAAPILLLGSTTERGKIR
ncbi:MAG: protein translocase subunit SecF, partial [Planctomycetota bacterium]